MYDKGATASWGPEMTGQMLESWTGETIPYEAQKDRNQYDNYCEYILNQSWFSWLYT